MSSAEQCTLLFGVSALRMCGVGGSWGFPQVAYNYHKPGQGVVHATISQQLSPAILLQGHS